MSGQTSNLPTLREWWEAVRWVLLIFTVVVFVTMVGSFVPYEQVVVNGHPWLPRATCAGCPLCGMTRSFCALSSGQWREGAKWNRGGLLLYAAGWLWLAACSAFAARHCLRPTQRSPKRKEIIERTFNRRTT